VATAVGRPGLTFCAAKVVAIDLPANVVVILATPTAIPNASPAAFTVATVGVSEVQVAREVTSCVVPLLYVAMEWNWRGGPPISVNAGEGVTVRVETVWPCARRMVRARMQTALAGILEVIIVC
jgi:hypothetical protein